MIDPAKYGEDVLSGKVDVCSYVKTYANNFSKDLLRQNTEGFPYHFDADEGLRKVKMFGLMKHYKGKWSGQPFNLLPWQAFNTFQFYGWRRENNKRRYKFSYIEVPKKNGKTAYVAGKGNISMIGDGEASPEVYCAATKEAQARLVLDAARVMGKKSPVLNKRLNIMKYLIEKPDDGGVMRALGSDSQKQDGLNVSHGIIDEYHAHPSDEMLDILMQGCGGREQPIIDVITTSGYNRYYPCYTFRNRVIDILNGDIEQDNLLGVVYTIDKNDDWKLEENWIKANPSWSIINQDDFREDAKMAFTSPSFEPKFKTKRLCVWSDSELAWLTKEEWAVGNGDVVPESDLRGRVCYAGADFAESKDLCALVIQFPDVNGRRHIKSWFWIPEKKVREKEDIVDYWVWKKQGFMNVIPGDAIDHEWLAADVLRILKQFDVQGMTYDKYGIGEATIQSIINLGYSTEKLHPMKQQTTQFQGPIRQLEEELSLGKINHECHPVLEWNIANAVLYMDSYGGVKFNKSKVAEKIDGAVALAMSISEEMTAPPTDTGEVYFL